MPLNPFEADVKHRLEQAGLPVIAQYGTSGARIDFALPHPTAGRMALAVEADGASYHASPTARDRDRLRQQMLERLGWRFHRIWSTDWFNDPQAETAKVVAAYGQAVADIDAGGPTVSPRDHADGDRQDGLGGFDRPGRAGRRPALWPGGSIADYRHADLVELARWIESDTLLRTEDQMVEEMMDELGFRRRGSRIAAALTRAIQDARKG